MRPPDGSLAACGFLNVAGFDAKKFETRGEGSRISSWGVAMSRPRLVETSLFGLVSWASQRHGMADNVYEGGLGAVVKARTIDAGELAWRSPLPLPQPMPR